MPEEALETQEIKERLDQAQEHGEKGGPRWIVLLSLSTALIAVLAAIAGLESGSYANDAIVQKNESILSQSKANDAWSYFQAKGIKAAVYGSSAEVAGPDRTEAAAHLREEGKREKEAQAELEKQARELEAKVAESDRESEHSLHLHHEFAKAVTVFQVAIALAAIAALTKKRPVWLVGLGIGAFGIYFLLRGVLGV